jgi:hypothetical protein
MRTKMIISGIIGCITLISIQILLSSFSPQETSGYLMMFTQEAGSMAGYGEPRIIIVSETGQLEVISIDKRSDAMKGNIVKKTEVLNSLHKKGYRLIAATQEPALGTYIFEKK